MKMTSGVEGKARKKSSLSQLLFVVIWIELSLAQLSQPSSSSPTTVSNLSPSTTGSTPVPGKGEECVGSGLPGAQYGLDPDDWTLGAERACKECECWREISDAYCTTPWYHPIPLFATDEYRRRRGAISEVVQRCCNLESYSLYDYCTPNHVEAIFERRKEAPDGNNSIGQPLGGPLDDLPHLPYHDDGVGDGSKLFPSLINGLSYFGLRILSILN